jgi:ACS family hexuronate transporter-like MFS transporter
MLLAAASSASYACRALLGLTEAANFPAAVKAIAEWFPRRDRSMAVGILTVGPGLGALLAPPLLGGLIIVAGWRAAFIVPALAGFVWLWFWLRYYRSPDASSGHYGCRACADPCG